MCLCGPVFSVGLRIIMISLVLYIHYRNVEGHLTKYSNQIIIGLVCHGVMVLPDMMEHYHYSKVFCCLLLLY